MPAMRRLTRRTLDALTSLFSSLGGAFEGWRQAARWLRPWATRAAMLIAVTLVLVTVLGWASSRTHPASWSTWGWRGRFQASNIGDTASIQWHYEVNQPNWPMNPPQDAARLCGVTFARGVGVYIPWWELCTLAALLAAVVIWFALPRRAPRGCCRSCGYNLTANVSGVCPECGTIIV